VPDDPIDRLRVDLKEDLAEIRGDIGRLVSRELHDVQLERVRDQVATVARDLDRLVKAVADDREEDKKRREAAKLRRDADRRVTKGALIAAALGIVAQILNSTGVLP
jgi:hypothetical protein